MFYRCVLTLTLLQASAIAVVFQDDGLRWLESKERSRFPDNSDQVAMTVGQIYSPRGVPMGTGVHIGSGKILVAYHLYANFAADATKRDFNYSTRFIYCPSARVEDCRSLFIWTALSHLYCDSLWDYCVFEVKDPEQKRKLEKYHVFISTEKPKVEAEVISVGFPGGFSIFDEPYASKGIIVDEERETEVMAEKDRPKRVLPSYPLTISGEKGISNSPVTLKGDPLLMVTYFWGVPEDHGLEKEEAIKRYREGVKDKKAINEIDSYLNWGVGAHHIADSLLKSPLKDQLCRAGKDRIFVCK